MTRPTIVAANWKLNGDLALVSNMSKALSEVELAENVQVILCPSMMHIGVLTTVKNDNFAVGAQNASEQLKGAFTGETSVEMLKEFGVEYVILGHSERRSIYHESSHLVAQKVATALKAGVTPILCIGESEDERASNQTETVLASQLQPVIDEVGIKAFANIVVAYEPVWAIGTGKTASPEMAQETHAFIRKFLSELNADVAQQIALLYGGSVNATNSEELFAQADIDGGLIGGASLKVDEFKVICSKAKG
ncbi:triosephosphate isomerase [Thalassotalea loyana]|uniref:Triosephosphate isomerase n=1 Tax=Thalassotalea loyana TaxID=280483 RepID=A0ABQ6HE16_9GAMM|nr:triose-phosphate isomerase [Thalassotalea loyana]GLX85669.1 triosephosphate isomerase [Thalassotalea loyana]